MKKNYLIIVFTLCSGLCAFAQPVITAASFQEFFVAARDVPDFTGITVGSAGANQTWDYSNLIPEEAFVYFRSIPQNEAPALPVGVTINPNYFTKVTFVFEDLVYESYDYQKITPTSYENLGSIDPSGGYEGYIDTPLVPLPLNYTNTYVDTVQGDSDPVPYSTTTTYDAYGSLQTPFGSFTNVVRLKEVDDTSTSYSWYKFDPYTPLMSIEVSNATGQITDVVIWEISPLSINETIASNTKISLFPNPTNSILNLKLPNDTIIDKVNITDITGKIIKEQSQNTNSLNVENLANGIYILQVFSGEEKFEAKFVKH